jgi:hypothetical protein
LDLSTVRKLDGEPTPEQKANLMDAPLTAAGYEQIYAEMGQSMPVPFSNQLNRRAHTHIRRQETKSKTLFFFGAPNRAYALRQPPSDAQQKASKESHAREKRRNPTLQPQHFRQKNTSITFFFTAGGPLVFQTDAAFTDPAQNQTASAFLFGPPTMQAASVPLYRLPPGVGPGWSTPGGPGRAFGSADTKVFWGAPAYT